MNPKKFVDELADLPEVAIDNVIVNAGVLNYPNRATEMSFDEFALHLNTNTVGPIICAQQLLRAQIRIGAITFVSLMGGIPDV